MSKYYYNDVLLTELPERSDYPYRLIYWYVYPADGNTYYKAVYTKHQVYSVDPSSDLTTLPYITLTQSESTDYITMFCSDASDNGWLSEETEEANTIVGYLGTISDTEYKLLWTDTDILKDSADNTEVYFGATEPVLYVPVIISPTYYNNVLLPEVPEVADKPHQYIIKSIHTNGIIQYVLVNTDATLYVDIFVADPLLGLYSSNDSMISLYLHNEGESGEWTYNTDGSVATNEVVLPIGGLGEEMYELIWANVDVSKGANSTEIYFSATEPVPFKEKIYPVKESTFANIANAIRAKTGKSESMTPLEMPSEIEGIESGGVGNTIKIQSVCKNIPIKVSTISITGLETININCTAELTEV